MKYILLHSFLLLRFVIFSQTWLQLPDFTGSERDDGTSFVINNKAYCVTGLETGWQCNRNGFVFDSNTEIWSGMASLPINSERQYATGLSHNNMGYVLGGINCNNTTLNDFWKYNPVTDLWLQLPNFPSAGRFGMSSFIIKNKLYVVGGKLIDETNLNEVWEYDFVTTTWNQKNNLPFTMWRGAAFSIDTIGYACLGINNTGYNHRIYKYNYVTDTWATISNITLPALTYVGYAVCNNKAILYGGQDSLNAITNAVYVFNPENETVLTHTGIPTFARKGTMTFAINDVFYITTGISANSRIKETWKNANFVSILETETATTNFKTYPNPANSMLNVKLEMINEATSIEITNALGQLVFSTNTLTQNVTISINNLLSGMYYLSVKTKDKTVTKKFIKE